MQEDGHIDKNIFEPDEEEQRAPTGREIILQYVRGVVALVTILGLLYISGVYQSFLYQRTPSTAEQERVESIFDAEMIILPLRVFVFSNDESLGSLRSREDVERLVLNAGVVWDQADIKLGIENLFFLEASDPEIETFLRNPGAFIVSLPDYNSGIISVFLARSLGGLNGIAFGGLRAIAVADFTTVYDFRAFAHEIGHVLHLNHTPLDRGRLMFRGANGVSLTPGEIIQARRTALNFDQ